MSLRRFSLPFCLLLLGLPASSVAQTIEELESTPGLTPIDSQKAAPFRSNAGQTVQAEQQFKPTFLISPLVQSKEASRGRTVEFEYEIESNVRPTRLELLMVGMKQEVNGVIMPDPDVLSASDARLMTPARVNLGLGEKHNARCRIQVPRNNNPFLAYGLLVKQLPTERAPANEAETQVGIQFMTQYLLRAEVSVLGARGDSVGRMAIESGELIASNGHALITIHIQNPTETAMEFTARTELVSNENGKRYRSQLWVPARRNVEVPKRYESRILANTRLRMEGVLPSAVFPGEYTLNVELLYKGRVYKREKFPITINSGDFPAQDATIVQVTRDVGITPSNIELSLRSGGSRIQSLAIENNSQQKIIATLTAKTFIGDLADHINFRPSEIQLGPGQKRRVLVTLGKKRDFPDHTYAFASVEVRPSVGKAIGTQDIPIALIARNENEAELQPESMRWQTKPKGFVIPLTNSGSRHVALNGLMTLVDDFGRQLQFRGGYGRWVLPGQKADLQFVMPQMPPPGHYNMTVLLNRGPNLAPLQMKQDFNIQAAAPAGTPPAGDTTTSARTDEDVRR